MNRRNFVLGLSVSALALAAGLMPQAADAAQVNVDMRPLESRIGRGPQTEIIRQRIQQGLTRATAGRPGTINVRIYKLSLAAVTYSSFGGAGTDYLEGEVQYGGRSFPLLVTQSAEAGGYWRAANFNEQRVASIADAFVGWARRKI